MYHQCIVAGKIQELQQSESPAAESPQNTGDRARKDLHVLYSKFPHYPDGTPDSLKVGKVWVCCDESKTPMVPLLAPGWRRASSTNPDTWRSYPEALEAYETGRYAGVGRVIRREEGLVGVDLDHCVTNGVINPRARRVLERLDSYSEISPSGEGVKVWVQAGLSRSFVKPGFEVYAGGRYFTITGQILAQYGGEVEDRSGALAEIIAEEFPEPPRANRRPGDRPYRQRLGDPIDLGAFLESAGVEVLSEVGDGRASCKYMILCPWAGEHTASPETG